MSFIDESRSEILAEVRSKRQRVLRIARTGGPDEEAYWLGIAGRMTAWIEQLEQCAAAEVPFAPHRDAIVFAGKPSP